MRKRRRKLYSPSSSHKLALMIADARGQLCVTPPRIQQRLEERRGQIDALSGPFATPDWVITQLATAPHIAKGWPNPCKAARMNMRRKVAA